MIQAVTGSFVLKFEKLKTKLFQVRKEFRRNKLFESPVEDVNKNIKIKKIRHKIKLTDLRDSLDS